MFFSHVMSKEGERDHAGHCSGSEKARETKDVKD